jgi:hypothetical protein
MKLNPFYGEVIVHYFEQFSGKKGQRRSGARSIFPLLPHMVRSCRQGTRNRRKGLELSNFHFCEQFAEIIRGPNVTPR